MDRTGELHALFHLLGEENVQPRGRVTWSLSPFLLSACRIMKQIVGIEREMEHQSYAYIGYDQHLSGNSGMSDEDRFSFEDHIQRFVMTCASSIHELKVSKELKMKKRLIEDHSIGIEDHHCVAVAEILFSRLGDLSKRFQSLSKERQRYDLNPLSLLCGLEGGDTKDKAKAKARSTTTGRNPLAGLGLGFGQDSTNSSSSGSSSSTSSSSSSSSSNNAKNPVVPKGFADRYVDEIAPPSKMKHYEEIAQSQKEQLFAESSCLHSKLSEDAREALDVERNINAISEDLSRFLDILASQQDDIQDVEQAANEAVEHVKETDVELKTTIARSESHTNTMIAIMMGMSFILLLLDYTNP